LHFTIDFTIKFLRELKERMVKPRLKNAKFSGREPKETNAENSELSSK
jgi:hypothetical protein